MFCFALACLVYLLFCWGIVVVVGGGGNGGGSKCFTALLAMFIVAFAYFNFRKLLVVFGGSGESSCFEF
jgi:hypothetical protein